ncbi:MAG: Calx-beta domain-containing protein, partial [Planctomycetaceae bacterium]
MSAFDAEAKEQGTESGVFRISRTGDTSGSLSVEFTFINSGQPGFASYSSDYIPSASGYALIPAGSAFTDITVTPVDDTEVEESEAIVISISAPASYSIAGSGQATVNIVDNDSASAPSVSVVATDNTAIENGSDTGTFTVTRSGSAISNPLTVNFYVSGTANPNAPDYDYAALGTSITIPANQSSATLTVTAFSDAVSDPNETVVVTIGSNGAAYTFGTPNSATVTIQEGYVTPTVTITATDPSASETGPDAGMFTVTRTGDTSSSLSVTFNVAGSASPIDDYAAIGTTVLIPANQASATISVNPVDDSVIESNETVFVTLLPGGSTYTVGTPGDATVTIADNDTFSPSTVTITATDTSASEPGTNTGTFQVTRTGGTQSADLIVNFSLAGSTATAGNDYTALGTSVTIPANQSSATMTVFPIDDQTVESSESVIVTLSSGGSGYTVGSSPYNTATVTIADNDNYLPPVFDSPPTPIANSTVSLTVCQNDTGYIDILGHDQDSVGPTILSGYAVSGASGFSIGTDPSNGSPAVVVSSTVMTGTYNLTVTAIDNESDTAQRSFAVNFTRLPVPGSTSITLQTPNTGRVVELASGETAGSINLTWSPSLYAESYDWILYKFDGGPGNGGWTAQGSQEQANVLSKVYSALTVGYYAFFVRGTNCGHEQLGVWAGLTFAIAAHGDLDPQNSGQHNNHEDACGCDVLPPGEVVADAHVSTGTGDLVVSLGNLVQSSAHALSSYLFPTYVSGGDSQIIVDATIPIPAAATDVAVDVEVRNAAGTLVGVQTYQPGENTFQINKDGIVSFRIDPNALNSPGGVLAPALSTGNYTVAASIRADLPGLASGTTHHEFSIGDGNDPVRESLRSLLAPAFSASGLNRLRIDAAGASLNRSIGTSVRFMKSGSAFLTPDGSFTAMTSVSISVDDPSGGQPKIATYKLTSASGMISLFDTNGLLLERCESNGDVMRFSYLDQKGDGTADDLVRVQSVKTAHVVDYGYVGGIITTVTDWVGRVWTYGYTGTQLTSLIGPVPESGKPAPKVTMTHVPGTTRLASYTVTDTAASFTETTQISWDAYGNVSQISRLDTQGNGGGTRIWSFESAESRQLAQIRLVDSTGPIDPQDQYASATYPDTSVAKRQVDLFGNTLREQRTVLGYLVNTTVTTSFQRNSDGQPTVVGPVAQTAGGVTTSVAAINYEYDSAGRMTKATYPDRTSETDATLTTEVWTYSTGASAKQPATYKNRVGNYFVYGAYSDSFPTQVDYYSSQGGTLVSSTRYTYQNGRLRTMATSDPNGLGGSGMGVEMYYDNHFNLNHARSTTASAAGVIAPASINDIWVSFGYDTFENLAWATTQYRPVSLTGSPATPSVTDANLLAVRTDVTSDVYGRILTTLSPVPAPGQSRLLTTQTYDAIGRMLTSIEPGSTTVATRTTTTGYNSFGELRSILMPDPDDTGSLFAPSVELTFDVNGNLYETRQKDGTATVSRVRSGFDSLGRMRFQSMALPGASGALQANESTYFQYDAVGRTTKVESPVGVAGLNENKYLATNIAYDDVLRKITMSYSTTGVGVIAPNVANTVQEFDATGRTTKVTEGSLSVTTAYFDNSTWSGKGTLVRTTDERGQVWWQKYGPTGLLTRTQTPDPDGTGPLVLLDTQNVYDYRGNIDTVTETSGALTRTTNYDFDFRDLLTTITSPVPGAGTSLPALVTTYGYDALQRPITEAGPTGVTMVNSYRDDGLLGT